MSYEVHEMLEYPRLTFCAVRPFDNSTSVRGASKRFRDIELTRMKLDHGDFSVQRREVSMTLFRAPSSARNSPRERRPTVR